MARILWRNRFRVAAALAVCLGFNGLHADVAWTAVWTNSLTNIRNWYDAENWLDGYIGGSAASDNVNLSYPFAEPAGKYSVRYGNPLELSGKSYSFHSITGIPMQVIMRTGENNGTLTVVDSSDFRGVWAQGAFYHTYIVNPESGATPVFQRLANGHYSKFQVASGGKAYIRDLLGQGALRLTGAGETVLNSPRSLYTRMMMLDNGGTLTVKSEKSVADAPAPGATWRFDAADEDSMRKFYDQESGRTYVTNWLDADGGRAMAYCPNVKCRPFLSSETVNGHHLVDFGGYRSSSSNAVPENAMSLYGPAAYMYIGETNNLSTSWNNSRNVRDLFVVFRAHARLADSYFVSPVGHNSSYYLPWNFDTARMFNPIYSVTGDNGNDVGGTANYRAWLDGEPYICYYQYASTLTPIAAWEPTELHVVALRFEAGSIPAVTAFGSTRGYAGKECGGFLLAEAISYSTPLTEAERRQTIDYLRRKWLSGMEARPYDLDAVVVGHKDAAIKVEEGDHAKIRTVRLAANVASSAKVNKTGAGILELEEVLPSTAEIEVKGGGLLLSHDTPAASTSVDNVPNEGLCCWLDATSGSDKFDTDANGVTKWYDRRTGHENTYATSMNTSGTAMPTLVADATSGRTVMDYGDSVAATQPYMAIKVNGQNSAVKEGFIVWKRKGSGVPGFICDGGRYGALRNNSNNTVNYEGYNYGSCKGMMWNVDGKPIETVSTTVKDFASVGNGQLAVINFSAKQSVAYYYLALSGWKNNSSAGGGCAIGEVLTYNRQLTDAERRNVTAYLMNKWENGATYANDTDDTVGTVTFTGTPVMIGTTTNRTVTTVNGSGAMTKFGAGKLTVGTLDSGITSIGVTEGTLSTTLPGSLSSANVAAGATLELAGAASIASLAGEGTVKCSSLTGLTGLSTTARADGSFTCLAVDGSLAAPVDLVVDIAVEEGFKGAGAYRILAADSVSGAANVAGWTVHVTGRTRQYFNLLSAADGIYVNVSGPGICINFR